MRRQHPIAVAALALAAGACAPGQAAWTVEPPGRAPYVLPAEPCGGYFIAAARLNGAGPYRLLLDSGAPTTLLAPEVARTLDAGSALQEVAFGALRVRGRIPVRVRSMRGISHALGADIDGIAGFSLFHDLAVTFDFPGRAVRVEPAPPAAAEPGVVRLVSRHRPFIRARIGAREVNLLVDTGFSGALALRRLTRYPLAADPVPVGASRRIGGLHMTRAARLETDVETGARVLERPIARQAAGASLLGQEAMRDLAVTLAPSRGLVRFATADGRAPDAIAFPPMRGTGLVLRPAADHLEVLAVLPGSAAAHAGARASDRVIGIDGVAVSALGCDRRPSDSGRPRRLRLMRDGRELEVRVDPGVLIR